MVSRAAHQLVGAEGAVTTEDVARLKAVQEFVENRCVVGGMLPFDKVLPSAVSMVEHSHDAHDREAAAGCLARGLGICRLVAIHPHPLGHRKSVQEIRRQDLRELHRVGGNRGLRQTASSSRDHIL